MLIRELLALKSADIHDIEVGAVVETAVARMAELGIGSLVVKRDGEMVGLLTERDIVRGMRRLGCDLTRCGVSEVMVADPVIAGPDDSLDYARDVMTQSRVTHLVILDGDALVGVMSFHDVARASLHEADFQNSLMKRYIRNWPE